MLRNTVYFLFYACGLIYTGILIASNIASYNNYSSTLLQTHVVDSDFDVSFFIFGKLITGDHQSYTKGGFAQD